jgi:hypothetical protein
MVNPVNGVSNQSGLGESPTSSISSYGEHASKIYSATDTIPLTKTLSLTPPSVPSTTKTANIGNKTFNPVDPYNSSRIGTVARENMPKLPTGTPFDRSINASKADGIDTSRYPNPRYQV